MTDSLPYILLVEDDADQAAGMIDLLEPLTRRVGHFISGRKLFTWLDSQTPIPPIDLILLDMRLPGEHGYELLPKIRAYPGLEQIRVLAVTSNVLPPDVDRARAAGFDGFIGKPINPRMLPKYVEYALEGAKIWKPL